uniref:ATP-dependent RNA helicase n=1 Tax=Babesia bovis TaxID=5865 RepID=A7AP87_BABBO|eukprot:XP_001611939.1 hypothetical protein [Babesia bovis T2Bo]
MNVRGMCHLWAFVGPGLSVHNRNDGHKTLYAFGNLGIRLPKSPEGFWNPKSESKNNVEQRQSLPLIHVPDCGPQGVVSYAGIYKDIDNLPARTLENVDIESLTPGAISEIGRMLNAVGVESLSRLQLSLFDELSYGSNALFHSETSTGKTFSMLLYATLRHYYRIDPSWLCSRRVQTLFDTSLSGKVKNAPFTPPNSPVLGRVMVLCPTKELAVQTANQLIEFTCGDVDAVRLIIDDQAMLPEDINSRQLFIVGSANQVNQYMLTKSRRYTRGILQHVSMIILDEIDRLIKVPNQYASSRRKSFLRTHPTAAFQLCQTLLALSPNRLQVVGASASISRHHIRFMDTAIQSYRKTRCPLAVIRHQDERTAANRYVSIPESVEHFFAASNTDSLGNKVGKLATILRQRPPERVIFFISSDHSLLSFRHYLNNCGFECKILHHEFGIRDNISKRFDPTVQKGLYDRRASTEVMDMYDSCKQTLETESGRVGRCGNIGRCIVVDSAPNLRYMSTIVLTYSYSKVLTWQSAMNCTISPLSDAESEALSKYKSNIKG